jgi:hypothetical protein
MDALFWQGVRADYARLQTDPEQWTDHAGELAEWDVTARRNPRGSPGGVAAWPSRTGGYRTSNVAMTG